MDSLDDFYLGFNFEEYEDKHILNRDVVERPLSAPPIEIVGGFRWVNLLRKSKSEKDLVCGRYLSFQLNDDFCLPWLRYREKPKKDPHLARLRDNSFPNEKEQDIIYFWMQSNQKRRWFFKNKILCVDILPPIFEVNETMCECDDDEVPLIPSILVGGGDGDQIDDESVGIEKVIEESKKLFEKKFEEHDFNPSDAYMQIEPQRKLSLRSLYKRFKNRNRVAPMELIPQQLLVSTSAKREKTSLFKRIRNLFSCKRASSVLK